MYKDILLQPDEYDTYGQIENIKLRRTEERKKRPPRSDFE